MCCVRQVGIGPTTSVLSGQRSTTELLTHTQHDKEHSRNSSERSNYMLAYQDSVLPLNYARSTGDNTKKTAFMLASADQALSLVM